MEINAFTKCFNMNQRNSRRFAWINNKWGDINTLTIPISDRGLTFADGLFETILILNGKPKLLQNHFNRLLKSALYLGIGKPPEYEWIYDLICDGIKLSNMENQNGCARINWSRGDATLRGIDIEHETQTYGKHRFWLEINHREPSFYPLSTIISQSEQRNEHSGLSQCKTFSYNQAIQAKKEAKMAGYDEALLLNTNQKICCGTTANLLVKRNNQWLTPGLTSGCLPGIMREQGLKIKLFKEAILDASPKKDDEWLLINSLSCHPINIMGEVELKLETDPKKLWESLL